MGTTRTRHHNSNHLLTLNIERRACRMLKHAWVPNVPRIPMLVNRYSSKPHPLRNSSPRHPLASVTQRMSGRVSLNVLPLGSDLLPEGVNPLLGFYVAVLRLSRTSRTSPHGPGGWYSAQIPSRERAPNMPPSLRTSWEAWSLERRRILRLLIGI